MKLYGKGGRAFRCLWMLEEAGLAFEHVPIDWSAGESRSADFLAINPNGKVPVLEDSGLCLFESLAINYHLARHHARHLWFNSVRDESVAIQWLAWGMGELEGPHDAANRRRTEVDTDALQVSLNALRERLSEHPYMLGEEFSVVDLNTACLLMRPQYKKFASEDEQIGPWFKNCTRRPALEIAMSRTD